MPVQHNPAGLNYRRKMNQMSEGAVAPVFFTQMTAPIIDVLRHIRPMEAEYGDLDIPLIEMASLNITKRCWIKLLL